LSVPSPAPVSAGTGTPPARPKLFSAAAWAPLKVELFRSLWIATSIAQIGTWVREAAGPTLMESLTSSWGPVKAEMVARVTLFSNLPIMLLSVFAGALADILDRRWLLIVTQAWMIIASALLGFFTLAGIITPGLLLLMTFVLGVGTAAFGPALQAVLPELVPKPQFALAINLNSIALNVARALGPALFILVVLVVPGDAGAGVSFLLTAASFVGALWVLLRWKRPHQRAGIAGERMWDGIRAGFFYTLHSRANRAILLRVFTFIVPALVIWSQVPMIATQQLGYVAGHKQQVMALLFAFVGMGAVFGVLLMPGLHARFSTDAIVNVCTVFFAGGLIGLAYTHELWLAALILIFMGVNWVIIPTNFNTATQKSVPLWVKGRAISFYLTVLFGSFAVGSAIWGTVTAHFGIGVSLLSGGISMAALVLLLAKRYPLSINEGLDLAAAHPAGSAPAIASEAAAKPTEPIALVITYTVSPERQAEFQELMREMKAQRRRNGASYWWLGTGPDNGQWIEAIGYRSRTEYSRQHNRLTKADLDLQKKVEPFRTSTTNSI
jgi:MFS family permease